MLTRRCNMWCAHCSVESGPKVRAEPTVAELIATVNAIADAGLRAVQLTGGEPMIRETVVFQLLRLGQKRGLATTMSSNGFWGRNRTTAWRKVAALKHAGLGRLTISYDRYHAEFQGPEPALHIARAAEWFDLQFSLNVTRVKDDPDLAKLVAPFEKRHRVRMRFYDVQAIGRARELPIAAMRGETSGFCNACSSPAVSDDGRVTACNGPAYFLDATSPLVVGSLREATLPELIERHTDDPILETIRRAGPERLLSELQDAGAARELGIRRNHTGICDLCIDINSNPGAVTVLRERLGSPRYQAELAARRLVIGASVAERVLGIEHANGPGAAKLWLDGASGRHDSFDAGAERIFGRADFDWQKSAAYLTQCGIARAVANLVDRASIRRWAPSFFVERIKAAAVKESLLDLTQKEVLRRLSEALLSMGETGVLLKGGALIGTEAFSEPVPGALPRRAAGDIDLLVSESAAAPLRNHLLRGGFRGKSGATRTGPHHLAPLSFNGLPVEIHTHVMPAFWGLPEVEMVSHARDVPGLPGLATLDAEGMLLHALTHSTAHLFSLGLRAAWDARWLLDRNQSLEVERLASWIDRLEMPRSFWVPARALAKGLIPLPQALMGLAPADDRQRRLETVADARIYTARESAFDLNPISKNGYFLMLHDSASGRLRHVASLFGREERESRRSAAARARERDPGHSALGLQLRQGMMHWRQYQRAAR